MGNFELKIEKQMPLIMKNHLSLLFALLIVFPSMAQTTRENDSLEKVATTAPDSTKADIYSELCFRYSFSLPLKAVEKGKKAVTITKKLGDEKRIAQAYNDLGMVYQKRGKYDTALTYYNISVSLRQKLGLKRPLAATLSKIGIIQYERGDYQVSLANQIKAFKIFEDVKDSAAIAYSCNNIGNLLNILKQFDEGDTYFKKSMAIGLSRKDNYIIAVSYSGMATNAYGRGNPQAAVEYNLKSLPLMEATGDKFNISRTLENLGSSYHALGDKNKAIEYYKKALQIDEEIGDNHGRAKRSLSIGDYLIEEGQYASAKPYLERGLMLSEKIRSKPLQSSAYRSMSNYYGGLGDYKNKAKYLELYSAINQEILNSESLHSLTEMQTKYETDKKEKEIKLLNQQKEIQSLALARGRDMRILLLTSLIASVVIAAAAFVVIRLRQKQKLARAHADEQTLRLKAIIETQETERKRIAEELHDGVGQMLCVAKMNASVLREEPFRDPELWDNLENILDQSVSEVRNVSHSMMPSVLMKVGLKEAVKEYTEQVNASKQVQIVLNADMDKRLNSLAEVSVYRVIQELISNSLKHGLASKVDIGMQEANGRLYVTVKDNGRGFEESMLTTNSGNGWYNIRSRLALLEGTSHISSVIKQGTEVKFDLPA
jgi:two-component system NarL family sensor kinase